jgi:hypothetical protein
MRLTSRVVLSELFHWLLLLLPRRRTRPLFRCFSEPLTSSSREDEARKPTVGRWPLVFRGGTSALRSTAAEKLSGFRNSKSASNDGRNYAFGFAACFGREITLTKVIY